MPRSQSPVEVLPAVPRWQRQELQSGAVLLSAAIQPPSCAFSILRLSVLLHTSGVVRADVYVSGSPVRIADFQTLAQAQRWCIEQAAELLQESHRLLQQLGS